MPETRVRSLGQDNTLEEEMATHSSILAWRIPWTEEPSGLQSMGPRKVNTTELLNTQTHIKVCIYNTHIIVKLAHFSHKGVYPKYFWLCDPSGGGHGNQLPYSCLENPHGQRSLVGNQHLYFQLRPIMYLLRLLSSAIAVWKPTTDSISAHG